MTFKVYNLCPDCNYKVCGCSELSGTILNHMLLTADTRRNDEFTFHRAKWEAKIVSVVVASCSVSGCQLSRLSFNVVQQSFAFTLLEGKWPHASCWTLATTHCLCDGTSVTLLHSTL